jgi:uncharacterized protein (DUF3084 family)
MVQEESILREWERELIGKQEQLHEEEQKLNEREELINNRFETLKQSEKGLEVTCAMLERDQAVLEQSEAELISRTVVVTDREEVLFLTPYSFWIPIGSLQGIGISLNILLGFILRC